VVPPGHPEWHGAWSTGNIRRVGMVDGGAVEAHGAGAPEQNWADVKVVFDKKKASSNPEKADKKVKIYGMSRRDPALPEKLVQSQGRRVDRGRQVVGRPRTRQVGLRRHGGTGHARHGPAVLQLHRRSPRGRGLEQKAEHGATLVAKYKGIRFFDEDIGEGTHYRVRADRFSWVGKRAGGWLATHGEMPSDGPSEDPAEDKERADEYDPEVYIINGVLHTMIAAAAQAPGVIMVACDEDEEEDDEEDE